MNTEKLKIIEDIVSGSPNRLRASYFISKYVDLYNDIMNYTNFDIPFVQKVWHWVNDVPNPFLCKCGKSTSFNRNWKDGYKKNCSAKCAQSNDITKEKRKKTIIDKWGVDNIAKVDYVKDKQKETNLQRYGCKSSFQNNEVRDKWKTNVRQKWGVDHYFQTDDFKNKAKKYYLQKWGVDHQLNVDEIKDKIKETCLKRYGVTTYLNTDHSRSCIKSYNISSYEKEIFDFITSLGVKCVSSDRILINPLLVDIYIPDHKLAIEFNGLYWHSELHKEKRYHLNKTELCNKNGVSLMHIWEDDWNNRKDIIKSIIKNKLKIINNKIDARKCIIKEVNNEQTSDFLNQNHLQGYNKFSYSLGLYYKDELVSLMTFGWRSTNKKREYELIRFCNKRDYIINGSASRLFKYFINNHPEVDAIVSYADVSIFGGGLYTKLGFSFQRRSDVNYWWVVKGVRRHRFTYNKKKLVKMGHDPLMTEVEIMHSLGNYRIFGCGQDKYIWSKN